MNKHKDKQRHRMTFTEKDTQTNQMKIGRKDRRKHRQTDTRTGKQTDRHTFLTPVLLEPDPPITTDMTSLFIASHIIVVRIAPENPNSWERGGGKDEDRGK